MKKYIRRLSKSYKIKKFWVIVKATNALTKNARRSSNTSRAWWSISKSTHSKRTILADFVERCLLQEETNPITKEDISIWNYSNAKIVENDFSEPISRQSMINIAVAPLWNCKLSSINSHNKILNDHKLDGIHLIYLSILLLIALISQIL